MLKPAFLKNKKKYLELCFNTFSYTKRCAVLYLIDQQLYFFENIYFKNPFLSLEVCSLQKWGANIETSPPVTRGAVARAQENLMNTIPCQYSEYVLAEVHSKAASCRKRTLFRSRTASLIAQSIAIGWLFRSG